MRPRLDFATIDPLFVAYAAPQAVGNDLVLHFGLNSAWGPYDLDLEALDLTVTGPGPSAFERQALVQRFHEHGHSYAKDPVQLTYVWPEGNRTSTPGHYEAVLKVPNRQHMQTLEAHVAFDVGARHDAPAPAVPVLVLGVAAVAMLVRRRMS
jgi:hypothetical protein